jgi:hypothetical protein
METEPEVHLLWPICTKLICQWPYFLLKDFTKATEKMYIIWPMQYTVSDNVLITEAVTITDFIRNY